MIELFEVTKSFAAKTAVDRLTLSLRWGELFAFLGPNGAGKTTTIKMLTGLLTPTSGTVRVGGFDVVTQGRQARQLLGYVPDQPELYDKLTGREFLEFVSQMYGMDDGRGRRLLNEQADTFEMHDFLDDLIESYSHGMKQRLVFAAALLHEPSVLVVDELMVGLDPKSARLVKDLLRRKADEGCTVFMSTHSVGVAEELADTIGIVDHGRLIYLGSLEQLRRQQQTDSSLENLFLRITSEEATVRSR